jgi:FKBP-type peptidyl-prolyl cis-trans isomerase FkpA
MIDVDYVGKLLNGVEFDANPSFQYPLGNLIAGWQIGIRKIQPGGRIRLLIPSGYAYGRNPSGKIPANSVLDFTITLKRAGF